MSKLRRYISYANVTSTLALFIALGGTSFAVTERTARSTQNTPVCCNVNGNTATLRLNSVRTGNIVNGQVTTADLATGAVIGTDLRDGSIRVTDLSPEVVARLKQPKTTDTTTGDDDSDDDDNGGDDDDNDNDDDNDSGGGAATNISSP